MAQVKIDAYIWDMICEHYAALQAAGHLSPDDEEVCQYIMDKIKRQVAHDGYMSTKRLIHQRTDKGTA